MFYFKASQVLCRGGGWVYNQFMEAKPRWLVRLCLMLLILAALRSFYAAAQDNQPVRYFYETGHSVSGDFLKAYESAPNPERLYGYPITEAFAKEISAGEPEVQMQYFQRALFVLRPENPEELRVELAPLGTYLYEYDQPGSQLPIPPNVSACELFSATGHQVCYTFLDFFRANGGVAQFGYPISEAEVRDGWRVQYFQRARFEWHPELPSGQRVALTDIGYIYFHQTLEDPKRLLPVDPPPNVNGPTTNFAPRVILNIIPQAFVELAVTTGDGAQTVYVVVQDQNLQPISGAAVACTVRLPSDETLRLVMPDTDEHGISSQKFSFHGQPQGMAEIQIEIRYDVFEETTITSYRIWW
jgi:hypothetical protein